MLRIVRVVWIEYDCIVYAKIKDQLKAEDWSLDEEEFEDADGNVLSKKMYNDLVRQGLIWIVCWDETISQWLVKLNIYKEVVNDDDVDDDDDDAKNDFWIDHFYHFYQYVQFLSLIILISPYFL